MSSRRVVVTGIGTINPLGKTIQEYFKNLEEGVSGSAEITLFDSSKFRTHFACEVKDYRPEEYFDTKQLRQLDRFSQFALIAADEAMTDSALNLEQVDLDRVGCIWGSGIGGLDTFYNEIRGYIEGDYTPRFSPFFIPRMIVDIAAGQIAMKYGLKGPNYCTVSACASSTHAIIDAAMYIQAGRADIIVTGGSEAPITIPGLGGFNSIRALSTRNDDPKTASRPFDKDRDGFVMGEGSGALVLESLDHALARGAKIYAEVVGGGIGADAYHLTAPHPEGEGAAKAMRAAIQEAGITPEQIDYINVHGTSTPMGDLPELQAITTIWGENASKVNISSTKSMTGHLLGAAGSIEALACIMAIQNGVIPPTINLENVDERINPALNLTPNVAQRREVKYAMSNTFGFGGHNSSILFAKYE